MSQHESLEEIEADEQRWQLENEFETMTAEQSDASGSLIGGLVGGAGSAVVFGSLLYGGYQMSQGNSMGNKFLAYRVQAQVLYASKFCTNLFNLGCYSSPCAGRSCVFSSGFY